MEPRTIAQELSSTIGALKRCDAARNGPNGDHYLSMAARHDARIARLCEELPSGSGFDNGTRFDLDESAEDSKLVFHIAYHHMNDVGFYDGWTDHTVTVRPAFSGLDIKVSGRNRNEVKEYIAEIFSDILSREAPAYVPVSEAQPMR